MHELLTYGQNLGTISYVLFFRYFKIQSYDYLTKKMHFYLMRKNSYGIILKEEPKEQHLSAVPKSCT